MTEMRWTRGAKIVHLYSLEKNIMSRTVKAKSSKTSGPFEIDNSSYNVTFKDGLNFNYQVLNKSINKIFNLEPW